jgi:hypothetical protein
MAGDIFGGKFQDILTRGRPSSTDTSSSPRRHGICEVTLDSYVLSGCPVQKILGGTQEMKKDGQVNQRPAEHKIANDFQ